MYPFHHPAQVYLFHAAPVVERDLANVIFDIDLSFHTRIIANDYYDFVDVHQRRYRGSGPATVTVPDLSMLTMNLKVSVWKIFGMSVFQITVTIMLNCLFVLFRSQTTVWFVCLCVSVWVGVSESVSSFILNENNCSKKWKQNRIYIMKTRLFD